MDQSIPARASNIGSEWRKWDLHVHSPETKLEDHFVLPDSETDIWDEFCRKLEESEVAVYGITDYFCIDGYSKTIENFSRIYPSSKKVFFPNIEFRTQSKNSKNEHIQIHVIFANSSSTISKILSFLTRLRLVSTDDETLKNKYCTPGDLLSVGYDKAMILVDDLESQLKTDFVDEEYIIIGVANGYGSLRPGTNDGRGGEYAKELDKKCQMFFGSSNNVDFFLNRVPGRTAFSLLPKPVISGCDAHSFLALDNKLGQNFEQIGEDGKKIDYSETTWIKADPTFEGLKQITYEPNTRVSISADKPRQPINTLNVITLHIPQNAQVGADAFCFAGNNERYELSPYFNCIIGGRGSGKSTILNFLGLNSKTPDSSETFLKNLGVSGFDPKDKDHFFLDGTEDFEFLAQSEIENFAKDKSKFTQAIYDRADVNAGGILRGYEKKVDALQMELDRVIQVAKVFKDLNSQKVEKEKQLRTLQKSTEVFSSDEYKELVALMRAKSQEIQTLEKWKGRIEKLRHALDSLNNDFFKESVASDAETNAFANASKRAANKINEALLELGEGNFVSELGRISQLNDELLELQEKIKNLIGSAGYTPESVQQIQSAPQQITYLEGEIEGLEVQIESHQRTLENLDDILAKVVANKNQYEADLNAVMKPLETLLREQSEENHANDIKEITLQYLFDEEKAVVAFSEEFYNSFKNEYGLSERSKDVCEFIVENWETFKTDNLIAISSLVSNSRTADQKYLKFLEEVFKESSNFVIFRAIRDKHLYDVNTYKLIQVSYDNREIEKASFGQRCTAVIVIMLLFGNTPLIIDEPETHLDSSLIANYLVPLIKKQKFDRQIIFATHNANFVVNGDAEKIFILKNTGVTQIIETTIENTEYRVELLNLEGGKEAFAKRGEKLSII